METQQQNPNKTGAPEVTSLFGDISLREAALIAGVPTWSSF